LLPRLNRLHRANANLPINVGTDNLLHGGMIKVALRLETVTGRAVYEMPVFAITPTLGPVPAVRLPLALHPFLDWAMMDIDSEAVTMIRQAGGCGVRAASLLHPPHTLEDTDRQIHLTRIASSMVVVFQHRHLPRARTLGGPYLRGSVSDRERPGQ